MKKRKILYISGTRADYGLIRQTLCQIKKNPKLKIEIAVTGMHLMPEFGETINEIKKDGFKIHKINTIYKEDNKESMTDFIGKFVQLLTKKIKKIKPDIILLLGDRGEMLGGAIVGAYLTIPVAHIHGGEVTSTVDEIVRHAITKLSHIHLVSTKKSAERVIKMGENSWRVYIVGAPGLDSILNEKLIPKKDIAKKYNLDSSKPILLVIQHPVTAEIEDSSRQIKETMEAIKELNYQTIIIYPNADAGGRTMIKVIEKYNKYLFIKIFKNIPHKDYLSLMKIASVMIGNSSSGTIEAPSLHLPVVNIGLRQEGREKAGNIIDVGHNKKEIKRAINKSLYDKNFKEKTKQCKNPYGDGKTGTKIVNILSKIELNKKLLYKKITY